MRLRQAVWWLGIRKVCKGWVTEAFRTVCQLRPSRIYNPRPPSLQGGGWGSLGYDGALGVSNFPPTPSHSLQRTSGCEFAEKHSHFAGKEEQW